MSIKRLKIFVLFFIIIFNYNCSIFQKIFMQKDPEFIIHSVRLHDINLSGFILKIDSELVNHYKFGLPESQLKFDVKVNDQLLSKYQSDKFQVASNASVNIPIFLKIQFADLIKVIKDFSTTKEVKLSLIGGVDFPLNIPAMPKNVFVPFKIEKTLPAFAPKITFQTFDVSLKNLKFQDLVLGEPKLNINIKLAVENQGGSPFLLSGKDLAFKLADQNILSLKNAAEEASRTQVFEIKTEIPLTDTLKKIMNKKEIDYIIKGNLEFNFKDVDFNQFVIPYEQKGVLSL